jgi:hypothetical protein
MITTPTVFVLGAGASADFGFPIGRDLLNSVVNFQDGTQQRTNLLNYSGHSAQELDEFRTALNYSGDSSIDAFLERRPSFLEIGKAAMAVALMTREETATIFHEPGGLNWMKYLFRRMQGSSSASFDENEVSFVTFNYDRVLEHFLSTALQHAWGVSEAEAGKVLSSIPIIHLHGQLGFLPWQSDKNTRAFNTTMDSQSLRIAAEGIKVVHEGVEDRKEQFSQAKELIKSAARVYFLGVGTSNVNMDRLDVMNFEPNKVVVTEKGLTETEYAEVRLRYGDKLSFVRHYDCRQMISNYVQWT